MDINNTTTMKLIIEAKTREETITDVDYHLIALF